jgi:hypothetical protein
VEWAVWTIKFNTNRNNEGPGEIPDFFMCAEHYRQLEGDESALPPIADVMLQRRERSRKAKKRLELINVPKGYAADSLESAIDRNSAIAA